MWFFPSLKHPYFEIQRAIWLNPAIRARKDLPFTSNRVYETFHWINVLIRTSNYIRHNTTTVGLEDTWLGNQLSEDNKINRRSSIWSWTWQLNMPVERWMSPLNVNAVVSQSHIVTAREHQTRSKGIARTTLRQTHRGRECDCRGWWWWWWSRNGVMACLHSIARKQQRK